jgi:hypothetical protein
VKSVPMSALAAALICLTSATAAAQGLHAVPALPPDSVRRAISDSLYAPENEAPADERWSAAYPRNPVLLWFRPTATQRERQQAVDAVGGEVVGGIPLTRGGVYFVWVRDDGTVGPLWTAIEKLRAMPPVQRAHPELSPLLGAPIRADPSPATG